MAQQDAAFKRIRDDVETDDKVAELRRKAASPWHGRGLNALMLVNNSFHELAAPFIFEVRVMFHVPVVGALRKQEEGLLDSSSAPRGSALTRWNHPFSSVS